MTPPDLSRGLGATDALGIFITGILWVANDVAPSCVIRSGNDVCNVGPETTEALDTGLYQG